MLFRWMETGFRMKTIVFSAVFCGLAMGTKYNGLVSFFLLTLFVPFLYSRHDFGKRPIFSSRMIRNYNWKNNPIYPLYDNWFNPCKKLAKKAIPIIPNVYTHMYT